MTKFECIPVRELIFEALELIKHGLKGSVTDQFNVLPANDLYQHYSCFEIGVLSRW